MPGARFFGRLGGAFLIGITSMVLAGILFLLLLPFMVPVAFAAFGALFLALVFMALWAIVYVAMVIGTAIVYLFRPMEVQKHERRYGLQEMKVREAGMRQKGGTGEPQPHAGGAAGEATDFAEEYEARETALKGPPRAPLPRGKAGATRGRKHGKGKG
jgi:uncharacterized protein (DUF58 family)